MSVQSTIPLTVADAPPPRGFPTPTRQQWILIFLLAAEVVVFSIIGTNFFTFRNFYEIGRLNVELGLIALAMTPVIVTGGIDLSVGSLMALSAVVFGKLWQDYGFSPAAAAAVTLAVGLAAGAINAVLITQLRIVPLIVTLGSFSLFRGVAEGITRGVENFTNFPASFLFLGQGYIGPVPTQLPLLVLGIIVFGVLLHRSTIGREWSAIGYSPGGAMHAGIPVHRRTALAYLLCSFTASLAAIIYVSRAGQATADAGTGYELSAITAVVLGGTSIFGGTGSILGTLLGMLAIAVLQNGLRLADEPAEWAGICTGLLLLLAIALDRPNRKVKIATAAGVPAAADGKELDMRNSQLAALCAVILAAALIVLGGNFVLVRSIANQSAARTSVTPDGGPAPTPARHFTIAMMPKSKGNAYFIAAQKGAEKAAAELGVTLLWDGPTDPDPIKQNEIVDTWITRGVDVIAVACENPEGVSTVLRKARAHGIKVITYDADSQPDARDFFVNQATPTSIGQTLMDNAARVMGDKGKFAIITGSLTAENLNLWRKAVEAERAAKFPDITLATVRPCDDIQSKAFEEASTILSSDPSVKLIMAICSPAVPGAAEAVKQSGRTDVKVIGLGLPNENKAYIHEGVTDDIVLWKTGDLGYLTVQAAYQLANGQLKPGDTSMQAGDLGPIQIDGDNILLGKPFTFTKDNVDQFDF
jgi:rhamnose transport system permease protein